MIQLSESTFLLYAAKHYDNPSCHDIAELEDDIRRIQYVKKLFRKYKETGELKERLILNHMIVLYNMFGPAATDMMFLRLKDYYSYLKPFVDYLNFLTPTIHINGTVIRTEQIPSDLFITTTLKDI